MKEVIPLISFFLSFCGSVLASNSIYYVSPVDVGGTCYVGGDVLEPCLPLTNYTQDMFKSNISHPINIILLFLPGLHLITSQYNIFLSNVDTFMMLPYNKTGNATVTVACSGNGTINIKISDAKVHKFWSMNVLSCSTSIIFILNDNLQHHIEMLNCSFHDNVAGNIPALLKVKQQGVLKGNVVLNLSTSNFTGNRLNSQSIICVEFSDRLSTRNVTVKNCLFQNNSVANILNITNVTLLEVTGSTFTNNNMSQVEVSFEGRNLLSYYTSIRRFHSQSYGISILCQHCDIFRIDDSTFVGVNINYSVGIKASQILTACISNCILQKQSIILNNHNSVVLSNSLFSNSYDTMYAVEIRNLLVENLSFISNRADPAGGAMYLLNCENVTMSDVNFTNNSATKCGGAVYAENSVLRTPQDRDSFINISNNTAGRSGGGIALKGAKLELSYRANLNFFNNSVSALDGKGGAIFITCSSGTLGKNSTIVSSSFTSNEAYYGGSLAVLYCKNMTMSDVSFTNNSATESGGAVYAIYSELRTPQNQNSFINISSNTAGISGGGIALKGVKFELSNRTNLYFLNNSVSAKNGKGGAIFVTCPKPKHMLIMNSFFISNRAYYGGSLAILNCKDIVMSYLKITYNLAMESGGAIYAENSVLKTPHDKYTIINISSNTAGISGGGVVLANGAKLELSYSANFYFTNNSVSTQDGKGGAIFVTSDDCSDNKTCPIYDVQLYVNNTGKCLHFDSNHADKGLIFYGSRLDQTCFKDMLKFFKSKEFLDPANNSHAIASDVVKLCFCENNSSNCTLREKYFHAIYLGQSISVSVVNFNELHKPVQSKIKIDCNESHVYLSSASIQSIQAKCQEMKFHVYSKTPLNSTVQLNIETSSSQCKTSNNTLTINIDIEHCPRGFEFYDDKCICDRRLGLADGCNIEHQTSKNKYNGWFEYDKNYLKISKHFCPLGYCNENYSFSHTQCANNHTGVLCGACVDNYSIGLGSWRCLQCTHSSRYNFIWLVPLMATAGVVLVVFLLLLKLTVSSGTIYGLIFYANVISVSQITNLPDCSIDPLLSVFIAWLNLDFGIERCFYSGMDTYQKTWLQFAFPFYIWFLVGIIIIVCHYSSRIMKLMGKRSIDILATLFLLSYAKLLKTIITALSFINIMIAKADNVSDTLVTHKVWTFDGNVDYLTGKHLPLFLVALFFFIFLFLPYTLLLTFGQFLRSLPRKRGLRWVRGTAFISIIDAYHAPYNRRHRYWTGLTLLTRCVLFTVFAANTKNILNTNIFTTVIITLLLLVLRLLVASTVYQNYFIDKLDQSFLLNLVFLAATIYYLKDVNEDASCTVTTVSITFAFITFLGIVLYHIYLQVRGTRLYKEVISKLTNCKKIPEQEEALNDTSHVTTSFVELRESLLEST